MKLLLSVICVCLAVDTVNAFTKDSGCGSSKGCWGVCTGNNCDILISWVWDSMFVNFTMQFTLTTNTDQYGAMGLTTSAMSMSPASVTACIMTNSGRTFTERNYWNNMRTNTAVTSPTDGLTSIAESFNNNVLSCEFARTVTNSDAQVFELTANRYMIYAFGGVSGGTNLMRHSSNARGFSSEEINLQSNRDYTVMSSANIMKSKWTLCLVVMSLLYVLS